MDEQMIEQIARAIYDASHSGLSNCYSWDDAWEDHQEPQRQRYYKEARAAHRAGKVAELSEALRDARDEMTAANYEGHFDVEIAKIDAALAPHPKGME